MSNLQSNARFTIHTGKLKEFKALAAQAMSIVNEKEKTTTLQYDWFFNDEASECIVVERFADSNAVFTHMGNVGELLGKVLAISDLSLAVYGDPSPELRKMVTDMNGKLYAPYNG